MTRNGSQALIGNDIIDLSLCFFLVWLLLFKVHTDVRFILETELG